MDISNFLCLQLCVFFGARDYRRVNSSKSQKFAIEPSALKGRNLSHLSGYSKRSNNGSPCGSIFLRWTEDKSSRWGGGGLQNWNVGVKVALLTNSGPDEVSHPKRILILLSQYFRVYEISQFYKFYHLFHLQKQIHAKFSNHCIREN